MYEAVMGSPRRRGGGCAAAGVRGARLAAAGGFQLLDRSEF